MTFTLYPNIQMCYDEKEDIYVKHLASKCDNTYMNDRDQRALREEIEGFFKRGRFINNTNDIKDIKDRATIQSFLDKGKVRCSTRLWSKTHAGQPSQPPSPPSPISFI